MFNKLAGKSKDDAANNKDQNAGRNIQSGVPSRRGTLKFYRGFNQKTNSSLITNGAGEGDSLGDKFNGQQPTGVSPYFQIGTNDGSNAQNTQNKVGQGMMS